MPRIRLSEDAGGTPGVLADSELDAHYGVGFLHGRFRPLQTLLLHTLARGRLSELLLPKADIVRLDALVHRLDLVEIGRKDVSQLSPWARERVDAYLAGLNAGLRKAKTPLELRVLLAKLPAPDVESLMSAVLVSAYLGLAEGQERMERALVECLAAGADPRTLETLFEPHLAGWDPQTLKRLAGPVPLGFATHGAMGTARGGSNAWAVTGSRTSGGAPIFAGDPHLAINQLPGLFFELRARFGDEYWLGVSVPGLPGISIGRTRHLAFSGTFSVPDNVDFFVEALNPEDVEKVRLREARLKRRFRSPLELSFFDLHGASLELSSFRPGKVLSTDWAGRTRPSDTVEAFLRLMLASSSEEAIERLAPAKSFGLHFIVADRAGTVGYQQLGRIPRRSDTWTGLYPADASVHAWQSFREGEALGTSKIREGWIATANEARPAPDGAPLSTLSQPTYRLRRIEERLNAAEEWSSELMKSIQLDVYSLQAKRFVPKLSSVLPEGPVRSALERWDFCFDPDSRGAHAFELARSAMVQSLAPDLGGTWFLDRLSDSELPLWWANALDEWFSRDEAWEGERGDRIRAELERVASRSPERWGDVQTVELCHLILGDAPRALGFNRGPYPLPGSLATPRQGKVVGTGGRPVVIAPAYRFVADLSGEGIESSLPGGIDGSRFSKSYDRWLDDYWTGRYHLLEPPRENERAITWIEYER